MTSIPPLEGKLSFYDPVRKKEESLKSKMIETETIEYFESAELKQFDQLVEPQIIEEEKSTVRP